MSPSLHGWETMQRKLKSVEICLVLTRLYFILVLQILRRLDSPEVAAVPGIVLGLLEGEGVHGHPTSLQLGVVSTH